MVTTQITAIFLPLNRKIDAHTIGTVAWHHPALSLRYRIV
jgi:hypothetical protein